jgi:hypothetical protein
MLQEIAEMGLRERFGGREPQTIQPVLDAIIEFKRDKAAAKGKKAHG